MIEPTEQELKAMIALTNDGKFSIFMDWIRKSKEEQHIALITAKGERRDNLQGSIPELIEIMNTVSNARKALSDIETLSSRTPNL